MDRSRRFFARSLFRALVSSALALVATAQVTAAQVELVGTWDGTFEPPGIVGGDPFSLRIQSVEGERVQGALVLPDGPLSFVGAFEPARGALVFSVTTADGLMQAEFFVRGDAVKGDDVKGDDVKGDAVKADTLAGQGRNGPYEWSFRATRASDHVLERSHTPRVVDLASTERPETFSLVGLETELGLALDELVRALVTKNKVVGASVACVVEGELVDVRSLGWEDFSAGTPASDETRYRWASISKPLTSTTALRLTGFDLDADVRELVPEFPEKKIAATSATITPRRILCHQSGIVHYAGARRTWREYAKPQPFEELANGLDLFREAPLLAAPGTLYSYSTHAWTLLGLTMERAGKKPYAALVRALVLDPAGMRSTEPDYVSRAIPHRAKGYEQRSDGTVVEAWDDDISWKLPGGGWISTVGDLARFGAALLGTKLLDEGQKRLAWTRQTLADGTSTDVGLGFFVGELEGQRLVSHSGGQRKASTYLALLPERRLAVAAMSNTEGAPMGELAKGVLRLLLARQR